MFALKRCYRAVVNMIHSLKNYFKAFNVKVRLFSIWLGKRKEISNWLKSWSVETSALSVSMTHQHDNKESAKILHTVIFRNGMKLSFDVDQWHNLSGLTSTFQEYVVHLPIFLASGDVVIDIGAHIGSFCIPLCWSNQGISVYAYEPDPQNFKLLSSNMAQNGLERKQLKIEQKAISGKSGECEFLVGVTSTTGTMANAGYVKSKYCIPSKSIKVSTISIEDIFDTNNIVRCKLLKLDCEGGEYELFYTAPNNVLAQIDFMVVEAHPIKAHKPVELKEFLRGRGFEVHEEPFANGCSMFYCKNVTLEAN